ncbi:hypothetical protein ACHAXS_010764, partial [Conticribra weissflogii]
SSGVTGNGNGNRVGGVPLNLRPVIFVVNATVPPPQRNFLAGDGHEAPLDECEFDVDGGRSRSRSAGSPSRSGGRGGPHHQQRQRDYDDLDLESDSPFDELLSALRGRPRADLPDGSFADDLSYASSGAPSPPRKFSRDDANFAMTTTTMTTLPLSSPTPSPIRKSSPFARLRSKVPPRWRKRWGAPSGDADDDDDHETAPMTDLESTTHSLARDIMDDDAMDGDDDDDIGTDAPSHRSAPSSDFLSRKARLVAVSRRHAFPPSKCPAGKLDDIAFQQPSSGHHPNDHNTHNTHNTYNHTAWIQSHDWTSEGLLPSGWLEKHARALPSAVVVVTSLDERSADRYFRGIPMNDDDGPVERHVVQAVEDLRVTLAEKRMVPVHLVCLLRRAPRSGGDKGGDGWMDDRLAVLKEKLCQECYLPQSQVTILRYPNDLESDEWEEKVRRSPYLPGAPRMATSSLKEREEGTPANAAVLGPRLRALDRAVRDSSAMYYSRLADHQEKKLVLWRNRYHSTNQSFVVNTTVAAMRCARYAMKAATLRELQMRTGGRSSWAAVAGNHAVHSNIHSNTAGGGGGNMTIDGGGGVGSVSGSGATRWTDRGSIAMRHYEEAYRWVIELHRRAISWRAAPVGTDDNFAGLAPMTPGNTGDESPEAITSPKFIDSPGGNIGVELAYPPSPGANDSFHYPATPGADNGNVPPPTQFGDRSMQRRNSNQYTQNGPFFSQLWNQCRAVASIINAKLLRSASTSSAIDAEDQWRRHRLVFLASPQNVPNFHPAENDDFFGPTWHRIAYAAAELSTFACIAEGRWRRAAMHSSRRNLTPALSIMTSYHQPLAPWRIYGELAEATLRLGREVNVENRMQNRMEPGLFGEESNVVFGRRKFVGSIVSGDGVGTMQWYFDSESLRDHRAMALEYVLHALDILKENDSMCPKNGNIPNSSEDEFSSEREYKPVDSSARLHYLAGRLLLGQDSPKEALSYLKMADSLTKKWPSLNIAVQRTLVACVDRCRRDGVVSERPSSKDASVEMLLRPEMCKLLSTFEKSLAQRDVWEVGYAPRTLTASKEVIWTDDESGEAKPPFEFTVSFSQSTHATASGKVAACVSIESCLGFPVFVSSIQLMTTSGYYDVANLDQCLDCSTLQSKYRMENLKSRTMYSPRQGVLFHPKEVVFFLTELTLPSDLSSIAPGGSVVDLTKFVPKNGKLCNMGYSYAGKNRLRCFITTLWRMIFLTSIQILTQLSRQHLQFEV